jgi:hypothetical protein
MQHTVQTSREVTVRATTRRINARPDGTCAGYRVDYPDGTPRLTYEIAAMTDDEIGRLICELAQPRTGELTDPMATGARS